MTDATPLDAAADGAFSGKLADPADTLTSEVTRATLRTPTVEEGSAA